MNYRFSQHSFLLLFLITLLSCKKQETDAVSILLAHTWYPYQTRITATDSTTVTETNGTTGVKTIRKYNSKWDTTYLNKSCQQQSALRFQQGGTYTVSNKCSVSSPDFAAQWIILLSNSIRTFVPLSNYPLPADYPYFGFGDIKTTDVNASEFIFTNTFHSSESIYVYGIQYDSTVVKDTLTYLTCRSR